jgi:hypothetical protein
LGIVTGPALSRVLAALERIGNPARPSGDEYSARCPNHDDRKPSLSVGEKSGKAVLYCHALCRNADILGRLSLAFEDLFDEPLDRKSRDMTARTEKEYHYPNLNGGLAGIETRQRAGRDGKRPVYPMTPQPDGSWSAKASETLKTTPFGLPLVVAAVERGDPVWVTEGPPDATTLIERCGVVATTNQGGAGKWTEAHSYWLKGADVVVCLDRNTAGDKHGRVVLATVLGVAHSVAVKRPPAPYTDVTDLIEAGGTLDQLEAVDIAELLNVPIGAPEQPVPEPPDDVPIEAREAAQDGRRDRWDHTDSRNYYGDQPDPKVWPSRHVDLRPFLDGSYVPPQPTVGRPRRDGVTMLYPAKWHTLGGLSESGKTFVALWHVVDVIRSGRHVAYFHFEETNADGTVGRLRELGAGVGLDTETIVKHFHWFSCETAWDAGEPAHALSELPDRPTLVVLDGINAACSQHGWDPWKVEAVGAYRNYFVIPSVTLGAAVLSLGHPVKDRTRQRERHMFGSTAWLDTVDGVAFRIEGDPQKPIGRGLLGQSTLFTVKDRYGQVARHGRVLEKREVGWRLFGEFTVDDTTADTQAWLTPPLRDPEDVGHVPGHAKDVADDERVVGVIRDIIQSGSIPNTRNIYARVGFGKERAANALARQVLAKHLVLSEGARNIKCYAPSPDGLSEHGGSGGR